MARTLTSLMGRNDETFFLPALSTFNSLLITCVCPFWAAQWSGVSSPILTTSVLAQCGEDNNRSTKVMCPCHDAQCKGVNKCWSIAPFGSTSVLSSHSRKNIRSPSLQAWKAASCVITPENCIRSIAWELCNERIVIFVSQLPYAQQKIKSIRNRLGKPSEETSAINWIFKPIYRKINCRTYFYW